MTGNKSKGLRSRDVFLNCLCSFKKGCESPDKIEQMKRVCSCVKGNLERFEPLIQANLLVEMRILGRLYNYYSGFEPVGKCRRS